MSQFKKSFKQLWNLLPLHSKRRTMHVVPLTIFYHQFVGDKAKKRILKWRQQAKKTHQIFGKFGVRCFLATSVLKFAPWPCHRQIPVSDWFTFCCKNSILHHKKLKKKKMIKTQMFWWKITKKCQKRLYKPKVPFFPLSSAHWLVM